MVNIFDDLGIALRAAQREAEIKALYERAMDLEPAFKEASAIYAAAKTLLSEIAPGLVPVENYNVEWIQQTLNAVAGEHLVVDGDYGTATRAAVKRFQAANGLVADGWVGLKTMGALFALSQGKVSG